MTAMEKVVPSEANVAFTQENHPNNPRLQRIVLSEQGLKAFETATSQWGLQAIEYKPFLRFAVANALDEACGGALSPVLNQIMQTREQGAFLFEYEGTPDMDASEFHVKLSTAISHLIGVPNFDAMYGKFYARFTVRNKDDSDSYLRQAHRRMELHNDGTYVNERTDFVIMMKMKEENMEGGDSLILHIDDWQDLERFYHHPLAKQDIQWGSPPSKQVDYKVHHPVFFEEDQNGKPHMLFIDQFAEPQNMRQGLYLHQMGESLEAEENCSNIEVPVGSMLVLQNHCWLHGRDKFVAHPGLERELLRQRGHFSDN
ncbi:MAG: carbon starvation induced protein CsiD [Gammaproteobacteria bacterium]|nr:carbon starvation induced protein CsiD [Gammaproteobacteria bacterium]